MKVLVIGGCGFIGSHIVDKFVEEQGPDEVFVLDSLGRCKTTKDAAVSEFFYINKEIQEKFANNLFLKQDTKNVLAMNSMLNSISPDLIIVATSSGSPAMSMLNPYIFLYNEIFSIETIISNLPQELNPKVIFLSCAWIYEDFYKEDVKRKIVTEKSKIYKDNHFALAKSTSEEIIRMYSRRNKISSIILRPTNIYGPRQLSCGDTSIIASLAYLKESREDIELTYDILMDLVYIDDFCNIVYNLSTKDFDSFKNKTVNIGSESLRSISNLLDIPVSKEGQAKLVRYPKVTSKFGQWKLETSPEDGIKKLRAFMQQIYKEKQEAKTLEEKPANDKTKTKE